MSQVSSLEHTLLLQEGVLDDYPCLGLTSFEHSYSPQFLRISSGKTFHKKYAHTLRTIKGNRKEKKKSTKSTENPGRVNPERAQQRRLNAFTANLEVI